MGICVVDTEFVIRCGSLRWDGFLVLSLAALAMINLSTYGRSVSR